jgi:formate dehydrogenase subunit gamma
MGEMVRKATAAEIINHWVLAGSCLLLILSGYGFLFQLDAVGALFGGFSSMKVIHNWLGVVFTAALVGTMGNYLKESFTFDKDDWDWLRVGGGYLTRSKKIAVPPMGKLNTGQKLLYIGVLICGFGIALSGFSIWLVKDVRTLTIIAHLVHNLTFSFFIVAIPVHAYLGTIANPGSFRIMVSGTVPVAFAKKKYPKWMKEIGKM